MSAARGKASSPEADKIQRINSMVERADRLKPGSGEHVHPKKPLYDAIESARSV